MTTGIRGIVPITEFTGRAAATGGIASTSTAITVFTNQRIDTPLADTFGFNRPAGILTANGAAFLVVVTELTQTTGIITIEITFANTGIGVTGLSFATGPTTGRIDSANTGGHTHIVSPGTTDGRQTTGLGTLRRAGRPTTNGTAFTATGKFATVILPFATAVLGTL